MNKVWKVSLLTLWVLTTVSQAQELQPQPTIISPNSPRATEQLPPRFNIELTVQDLNELRVREGQRLVAGQVISDRSLERQRLESEKRQTVKAIAKLESTPKPTLKLVIVPKELPLASFAIEEAVIAQAELKFAQAQRNYNNALSFDPFIKGKANLDFARVEIEQAYRNVELQQRKIEAMRTIKGLPPEVLEHETEKLKLERSEWEKKQAQYDFRAAEYKQLQQMRQQEIAELQNKLEQARAEVELAQAKLRSAREQRRQLEYEHEINLARYNEQANQNALALSQQNLERDFKLSQFQERLAGIEQKIAQLAVVRSPYTGTVKRVKTVGQSDNTIRVILTLIPSSP